MKDYSTMSTKKLNAILSSASEEEAIEIQKVLDARSPKNEIIDEEVVSEENISEIELSDEDKKALAEIENVAPEAKTEKSNKANKATYDECVALAKSLEPNIGHKVEVVPFNTIEWTPGIIRGVIADKRSNKVLYAIRCDDGRAIVKAHDSKMIKISEETGEIATKRRKSNTTAEKLNDVELDKVAYELSINVGKHVKLSPTKEIYRFDELTEMPKLIDQLDGIIMAIVPDKRSGRILYRIESNFIAYDEKAINKTKVEKVITHKVSSASDLVIADEYDEEIRNKFVSRQAAYELKKQMSPADLLEVAKKAYDKSIADVKKATEIEVIRAKELKDAEAAYEEWMKTQIGSTENEAVEGAENEAVEETEEQTEDLN